MLATMQPPTPACKDDINVCLTLPSNGLALMGAMRKVLARKVLSASSIGLRAGPDGLPQVQGIENIALDRVVGFGWVRLGLTY